MRRRPVYLILFLTALTAMASAAEWMDLTPPPDLEGWTRVAIPGASGIDPYNQWTVKDGVLICRGDGGPEWLRYDEELSDFILRVEWQAVPREGTYNSGVGVRMSRYLEIWHQAQTKPEGGFLFGRTFRDGSIQGVSLVKEMTENRVKPAGEWNSYEIRCEGSTVTLSVNGAVVNVWKDNQVRRGYIGFEAEGFEIHFRNIQVKKLD